MEEQTPPAKNRRMLAYVIAASFLLGSFSGAAFGVLFAVSLNQKYYPWRDAAETASAPAGVVSAEDRQVIEAVRKASPSVVSVVVSKEVSKIYNRTGPFALDGFYDSGSLSPQSQPPGTLQQIGGGTGFIISADGLVLTNRHVVEDKEASYGVVMADGRTFPAKVVALDGILDAAVLKIEATGLPVPELGDSDALETGETVVAIGNALSEYRNTVTKGVISGINRRVVAGTDSGASEIIEEALQTDAAINPGNSGGPLINVRGQVIGMNTAVNRAGQSIGFAIPINAAKVVIESVKASGRIIRPWLGVRYVMLTAETAKANGIGIDHGALIVGGGTGEAAAIVPGSPAEKAGLKTGDVLLDVDGMALDEAHPLSSVVAKKRAGDVVTIKYFREKSEHVAQITLAELPDTP